MSLAFLGTYTEASTHSTVRLSHQGNDIIRKCIDYQRTRLYLQVSTKAPDTTCLEMQEQSALHAVDFKRRSCMQFTLVYRTRPCLLCSFQGRHPLTRPHNEMAVCVRPLQLGIRADRTGKSAATIVPSAPPVAGYPCRIASC